MFMSQLVLDRAKPQVQQALADIYRLHQMVMGGFAAHLGVRVLYRVEPSRHNREAQILVQSPVAPEWKEGDPIALAKVKNIDPGFSAGQKLQFRLRANPTVKCDGRRLGLIHDEDLCAWLNRKEEVLGVRFGALLVADEGYLSGSKRDGQNLRKLQIKTALFEGVLVVRDPQLLGQALRAGIGPAKGFGCGLMSLARA